jgi:hypothetical protein
MSAQIVNVPQFQASYHASKARRVDAGTGAGGRVGAPRRAGERHRPGYMLSEMTRQFTDANPDPAT